MQDASLFEILLTAKLQYKELEPKYCFSSRNERFSSCDRKVMNTSI